MEKKVFQMMINNQIENNKADLELLNVQLDFYNSQLKYAITKDNKKKIQSKIDSINRSINVKINDIEELFDINV